MSLQNKVVIITGGGTGIGADAARAFVQAGARVVLNGRRETPLRELTDELNESSPNECAAYFAGDIGDAATGDALVQLALQKFGGLDILLNNAGVFFSKPFLEHTPDDLDGYLRLLRGYFLISQAALREMRDGGAIINIGSMWANHAIAATPCAGSSTAKGGVHALTRNLALEFAPRRIRVNCLAPAVVETPLFDAVLTPEQLASFDSFHPLGRNGQPRDITEAILFLADETRSGWMTGAVLPLDGGVSAGRN